MEDSDAYNRSMGIIYGRELINSITWDKVCSCEDRPCSHDRIAVQKGVDCIVSAMDGRFDFAHLDAL
jgi:hypothetical protein